MPVLNVFSQLQLGVCQFHTIDLETLDSTPAWPLSLEMVWLFPKLVSTPRLRRLCQLTV